MEELNKLGANRRRGDLNEADTCREYIVPRLVGVGWDTASNSIAAQRVFADGRVFAEGQSRESRKKPITHYDPLATF